MQTSSKTNNGAIEMITLDETKLKTLLAEIVDDPEKFHTHFVLKWCNDDAMACLADFIHDLFAGKYAPKSCNPAKEAIKT